MEQPNIVSREEWLAARRALLAKEKQLIRQRDQVSALRRRLPWVRLEDPYVFDGPNGKETLAELFAGKSQLIAYHFMFAPGWEEGCDGCSFLADHIDGANLHLAHHDVSLIVVSRAPYREFQAFKQRMGWRFNWVSSHGNDFNYDFGVSITPAQVAEGSATYNYERVDFDGEMPGISVFCKNAAGEVFHTYSSYARGGDLLIGAYNYLDLTPKGRNEASTMDWVRLRDRYEGNGAIAPQEPTTHQAGSESCCHAEAARA